MSPLSPSHFRSAIDPALALAGLIGALALAKLALAGKLDLFGDEAFYWLEGRHPALAYSDLPPLTAWLIRAGTELLGDVTLGVRALALVAGSALPWLVYRLARAYLPRRQAAAAGLLSLGLPLAASLGLLALPDVWINVLWVVLLIFAVRALDGGIAPWLGVGLAAALGLATHYRFAVLLAALAGWLLATRRGRALARGAGPWLAAALAALGALPSVWFNLEHDFGALAFQLQERHPWRFQWEGLRQPVIQVLVTTPGMFALLFVAAMVAIRRARAGAARWALLAWAGAAPWLFYLAAAPFTDQQRTSFHWPLAAYLPLCVALPAACGAVRDWFARGMSARLAGALVTAMVGLGAVAAPAVMGQLYLSAGRSDQPPVGAAAGADNLFGWSEAAEELARLRTLHGAGERVIADHFMLAAELAFEGRGVEPVYALDHPLNAKHGRALQLRLWGLDEAGLSSGWGHGWLVVEETATGLAQRPAWLRRICDRFGVARLVAERAYYGGLRRLLYYRVAEAAGDPCDLPAFAYLDAPGAGERLGGTVAVRGWAFEDEGGVAGVEVLLDGVVLGAARYGLERPEVRAFFAGSSDPNHPRVGFEFGFDSRALPDGRHWLALRTRANDGGVRTFDPVAIEIANR